MLALVVLWGPSSSPRLTVENAVLTLVNCIFTSCIIRVFALDVHTQLAVIQSPQFLLKVGNVFCLTDCWFNSLVK